MYYYIYDSFLENNKYVKIIDRIELRLSDLGISGERTKVRPLRDMKEIILEIVAQDRPTIVAVGNDHTFKTIADIILNQTEKPLAEVTLGIIPVGLPKSIATALGVPAGESACEAISARIVKILDLGKIHNTYFLTRALVGFGTQTKDVTAKKTLFRALRYRGREATFRIDDKFQVRVHLFQAAIVNLSIQPQAKPAGNPEDGIFNVFITSKQNKFSLIKNYSTIENEQYLNLPNTSIFKARKVQIISPTKKQLMITADNHKIGTTPLTIQIVPHKLKMIVGRNRAF